MRFSCSVMSGLALLQLVWSFTHDCCPGSQDDWHVFRHHFYGQGWKEGQGQGAMPMSSSFIRKTNDCSQVIGQNWVTLPSLQQEVGESSVMIGLDLQDPQPGQEHMAFPNKIGVLGMECKWGRPGRGAVEGWLSRQFPKRVTKYTVAAPRFQDALIWSSALIW